MEYTEAKNSKIQFESELAEVENELKETKKIYMEYRKKFNECENKQKELSKKIKQLDAFIETENIFNSVNNIVGFDTLLSSELLVISNGMDKTDYRRYGNFPRWNDLERLVKEVIEFKKKYPGWILEHLKNGGQLDTLPPRISYKFEYKTPEGYSMSMGGIQRF